jgi:hypothetical protein
MRASKDLEEESSGSSGANPDFSRIQVPDLHVEYPTTTSESTAGTWLKLARDLQDEYDGELQQQGGASVVAEIQVGALKKVSLTTGGWKRRVLDDGPEAVVISALLDSPDVELAWTPLYDETFSRYEIHRGTDLAMRTGSRLDFITDNHTVEYVDEDVPSGTYYYRIKTCDRNELYSYSNTVRIVVT